MTVSRIDIANMALLKIGQPPIMSLSDNSLNARRANQEIEVALETVLRAYPWPFAVDRIELPRRSEGPAFQFLYYYDLPNGLMRIMALDTQGLAYSIDGSKIATNAERVFIKFVSKDKALEAMDAQVVDLVALQLAVRISVIVTENPQLQGNLLQMYGMQLAQARSVWASEDMPQTVVEGGWIPARYDVRGRSVEVAETFNPWGPDGLGVSGPLVNDQ